MKKILLGFILGGIVCTSVTLVIASALYKASDVSYTNPKSEVTNVQDAINEILEKNGLIRFNEELGYIQARTTKDTWINLYKTKSVPIVAYNLTVNVSHSTNSSSVRITVLIIMKVKLYLIVPSQQELMVEIFNGLRILK